MDETIHNKNNMSVLIVFIKSVFIQQFFWCIFI